MTETQDITALRNAIVGQLNRAAGRATSTLAATPADKLDFKPSETSKSVRELAQHILFGNCLVLGAMGVTATENPEATDVQEISDSIASTTQKLVDIAQNSSPADYEKTHEFFGHPFPLPNLLLTADWHIARHVAQIDYVQTVYGDLEDHG